MEGGKIRNITLKFGANNQNRNLRTMEIGSTGSWSFEMSEKSLNLKTALIFSKKKLIKHQQNYLLNILMRKKVEPMLRSILTTRNAKFLKLETLFKVKPSFINKLALHYCCIDF